MIIQSDPIPTLALSRTRTPAPVQVSGSGELELWLSPALPGALQERLLKQKEIAITKDEKGTAGKITVLDGADDPAAAGLRSVWVYALVAPFPTVVDGVSEGELLKVWKGLPAGVFKDVSLLVSCSTLETFTKIWGKPGYGAVQVVAADQLLESAWKSSPSWAIVPFEELDPRWKVLAIDGMSPLDKNLDMVAYPLKATYGFAGETGDAETYLQAGLVLPATNRNPDHMTTLIMTGTTALVRTTALRIEEKGLDYPARDILQWLQDADLTHISNEVPFYKNCPPAKPLRKEMRFCSDPRYIELFEDAGVDIIELTGNHVLDWGGDAFRETLALYREKGFRYYGGGENIAEAQEPLLVEDHGNRLAFLGCNPIGPENVLATEYGAGAAPCNFLRMEEQIGELIQEGYLPVVTFQHFELDDYLPQSAQRVDSENMAKAGAIIVSGSQAHHAQCMTFYEEHFVHYGLGNLFFDQMNKANRPSFIDRHVVYEGRYISTELLVTELEDYARPRPMTEKERAAFLEEIFELCNWKNAYSH